MNEMETLLNSLSDEVKKLVSENKWSDALNSASMNEKDAVAELYLRTICEQGNQWDGVDWNKIEPIKRMLIKWIKELGLKESTNPYMKFISAFYSISSNSSRTLTENNCIELNNLYANGVLDFSDIAGIGENKLNHIIFNQNLYNNNMSDLDFIVRAYESLSSANFAKKINVDAVKEQLIRYKHKSNADYIDNNADNLKELRNAIIYKEPTQPQTSEIFKRNVIEDILSSGENTVDSKDDRDIQKLDKDYNSLTDDQKRKWLSKAFPTMGKEGIERMLQNAEVKDVQ